MNTDVSAGTAVPGNVLIDYDDRVNEATRQHAAVLTPRIRKSPSHRDRRGGSTERPSTILMGSWRPSFSAFRGALKQANLILFLAGKTPSTTAAPPWSGKTAADAIAISFTARDTTETSPSLEFQGVVETSVTGSTLQA